jgi:hypothetical protein
LGGLLTKLIVLGCRYDPKLTVLGYLTVFKFKMVVTRPQAKAIFNHVLDNVLGRDDTSGLKMSLLKVGVHDIFDLCTIEESTIDALCYEKSPTEADLPISRNDKTLLRILKSFVGHLRSNGSNPLSLGTDWTSMTQEEFDDFRVFQYRSYTPPPSQPSPADTSSAPMTTPPKHSPADHSFHRGIKCEPSLFPVLKEEKSNDTWHRSFANQARSQDIMQALDPAYKATKVIILGTPKSGTPLATSNSTHLVNLHDISAYDFLQAHKHKTTQDSPDADPQEYYDASEADPQDDAQDSTVLVNNTASQRPLTPGDIRRVMSTASKRYKGPKSSLEVKMHVTTLKPKYCQSSVFREDPHEIHPQGAETYVVSNHTSTSQYSLVDQGSNGGVAGNDV